MTRMQFQIACKHCHRTFAIEAESSKTVKCNCPYCGESMTVATPRGETTTAKVNAPILHRGLCRIANRIGVYVVATS